MTKLSTVVVCLSLLEGYAIKLHKTPELSDELGIKKRVTFTDSELEFIHR